jgi:hypothetical protein
MDFTDDLWRNGVMGAFAGPDIVENGLVLCLDAANRKSYPSPFTGTTWTDLSGNGNTGTLNGTINGGVGYSGLNGGSLTFDGTDDYVNCGTINLQQNFSLEIWAYHTSVDNSAAYFGQGPSSISNQGLHIWYSPPAFGQRLNFNMWSNDLQISSFPLRVNGWSCFVFTYNHSTYVKQIYVDGVFTSTHTGQAYAGSGQFNVGRTFSAGPTYMNGRISIAKVYNRVLTATEIQQNFNATRSRYSI